MIPEDRIKGVALAALLEQRHPVLFRRLKSVLVEHGITVRILTGVRDIWARDYSPVPVEAGQFVKFRYEPSYLNGMPHLRSGPEILDQFRDLGRCRHSHIRLDGGNVVASQHTVIVTGQVYRENPSISRHVLREKLRSLLKVDRVIVIHREPYDPIGHSDAMVRFIDEQSVLVNDYSQVDPAFGVRLLASLQRHSLSVQMLPYVPEARVHDGIPSAVGNFANYLRTANVLIAPVYGVPEDDFALRTLKLVFPTIPVVPLECTALAREGGVLHCISSSF